MLNGMRLYTSPYCRPLKHFPARTTLTHSLTHTLIAEAAMQGPDLMVWHSPKSTMMLLRSANHTHGGTTIRSYLELSFLPEDTRRLDGRVELSHTLVETCQSHTPKYALLVIFYCKQDYSLPEHFFQNQKLQVLSMVKEDWVALRRNNNNNFTWNISLF